MSELPDGWAWATLEEIAAPEPNAMTDGPFGSSLKTSDYVAHGVRVIRLSNIGVGEFVDFDRVCVSQSKYETLKKHEVFPGDLVVAALADPVGRCAEVPVHLGKAIVKADCVRLKVGGELERRYVMHCLNSPDGRKRAEEAAHGIGRLRINMVDMRALRIPLAPAPEQRRIVAKVEAIGAKSRRAKEALDAIPALLERFRQSVLAAAFRGDLTADWREKNPDVEPAEELLKRIRAERRRRWEEAELAKMRAKGKVPGDDRWKEKYEEPAPVDATELPELPEGWAWARWAEISNWVTYGFTRPMPHVDEGPLIITAKNVIGGRIEVAGACRTTQSAYADLSDKDRPEPGDILITKDGTIGRAAVVPEGLNFCINQSVAVIWLRGSPLNRRYLLTAIEAPFTQRAIFEQARGMAIQHLSVTDFANLPLPMPPIKEQEKIVEILDGKLRGLDQIASLVQSVCASRSMLDRAILAKAFRGELVPQDPNDEPASVLLERLRAEREQNGKTTNGAGRRRAAASPPPASSTPAEPGRKPHASRRSQAPVRSRG